MKHIFFEGVPELTECRPIRRPIRWRRVALWTVLFTAIGLGLIFAFLQRPAKADSTVAVYTYSVTLECFDAERWTRDILPLTGMNIAYRGHSNADNLVIVLLHPGNDRFSILYETPDGLLCPVIAGSDFAPALPAPAADTGPRS